MIAAPLRMAAGFLAWADLLIEGGESIHLMRSRLLLLAGRPAEALRSALDGLTKNPNSAELH